MQFMRHVNAVILRGSRTLKQATKLLFPTLHRPTEALETYTKSAVTCNYCEESINGILDHIMERMMGPSNLMSWKSSTSPFLIHLAENVETSLAILRCHVIRTSGSRPNIHASIFYLGIAMFRAVIVRLRIKTLELVKACVKRLDKHRVFKDFEAYSHKNPMRALTRSS